MFVIDVWRKRYPRLTQFLDGDLKALPADGSAIWGAFLDSSQLSPTDAISAVTFSDARPVLWFDDLGASEYGYFDYSVPGRIEIATQVASRFESDSTVSNAKMFARITALHELCNWAIYKSNGPDVGSIEPGIGFQNALVAAGVLPGPGMLLPWWGAAPPAGQAGAAVATSSTDAAKARADFVAASLGALTPSSTRA